MIYNIPFDTPTGKQIADYLTACDVANAATAQFIMQLGKEHPKLGFPEISDEQASKISVLSEESLDAGGLLGVSMDKSDCDITPDPDLWVRIDLTDTIIFCPRFVKSEYRWVRYRQAVKLFKKYATDPTYRFETTTDPYSSTEVSKSLSLSPLVKHQYKDVKRSMLPANRNELTRDYAISDKSLLALVTRFSLRHDYDPNGPGGISKEEYKPIGDPETVMWHGRTLFRLIEKLPTVPANTLLRILKMHVPAEATRGFRPTFEYKVDEENHQYIIDTNLAMSQQ